MSEGSRNDLPTIPELRPIGVVRSPVTEPKEMPRGGVEATIEIDPRFAEGLLRIEEHSHLWILSWFHRGDRETLQVAPARLDPDAPTYGVFGLRAYRRPNPIGLSLVELLRVEGSTLHVRGLDAIDGTPVLDIKSYFERDCVFSPRAPVLRPPERDSRWGDLVRLARQHHQEECEDLFLGVRMALIAEEHLGKLTDPGLRVEVEGSGCVADTIQGLTRARFANPPRFTYRESTESTRTAWTAGDGRTLTLTAREGLTEWALEAGSDEDLLEVDRP